MDKSYIGLAYFLITFGFLFVKRRHIIGSVNSIYNLYSIIVLKLGLGEILKPSSASSFLKEDDEGMPYYDYGFKKGRYIGKAPAVNSVAWKSSALSKRYPDLSPEEKTLYEKLNDWLITFPKDKGDFAVYAMPCSYPDYDLKEGWVSGMGQASAIKAVAEAYNNTKEEKYIKTAKKLLRAFFIDADDGGLRIVCPRHEGWWYVKRAQAGGKNRIILNSFQFILIMLHWYYKETGDQDAKILFDKGITELKNHLQDFDAGNWTYYDSLKIQRATLHYHKRHIEHLNTLYGITKEPVFKEYRDKWSKYKGRPGLGRLDKALMTIKMLIILSWVVIVLFILPSKK